MTSATDLNTNNSIFIVGRACLLLKFLMCDPFKDIHVTYI